MVRNGFCPSTVWGREASFREGALFPPAPHDFCLPPMILQPSVLGGFPPLDKLSLPEFYYADCSHFLGVWTILVVNKQLGLLFHHFTQGVSVGFSV